MFSGPFSLFVVVVVASDFFTGLLCTTGVGLGAALIFTGVNVFHIPANSIMKSTTDQIFAIRDKLEVGIISSGFFLSIINS